MKRILIRGGRIVDPSRGIDETGDLYLEDGRIRTSAKRPADEVIDAKGLVVAPGLIDMHVHLREPGNEDEETIESGSMAAVAGGFTSVAAMPNTHPPVDNVASAEYVLLQSERAGGAHIFPIGAVTKGRLGKELAEIGQLSRGGAVAFSDDGDPIGDAAVMRRGLQYVNMFGKAVISHCEDKSLSGSGVMNEGVVAMKLGLSGIPASAEEVMVSRDLILAKATGARLHIAHVSTAGSVELVRRAKAQGVRVTAEATPHHFTLTHDCILDFDTNCKMNPPLRSREDVEAVKQGLADGTIDAIASDHAPHSLEEKDVEFPAAPFGVIGMESMLPLAVTELLESGLVSLPRLISALTVAPAGVLNLRKGTLADGADADVTLIDLKKEWVIDASKFRSKSRNCPFQGRAVKGKAVAVLVGGHVFRND
ncbi:MAG: dihydroorotase [Planctomycetes bacterium]|nr:dihydroorotase [Planctomycetota bacterium]